MKIDLDQLNRYNAELEQARADLAKAKHRIEYLRLQAKQTREQAVKAKRSQLIKSFIHNLPSDCDVKVTPAPGQIYVSVTLSLEDAQDYAKVPEILGLKLWRDEPSDKSLGGFAGADLKVWRTPHEPGVFFYIQNHWK